MSHKRHPRLVEESGPRSSGCGTSTSSGSSRPRPFRRDKHRDDLGTTPATPRPGRPALTKGGTGRGRLPGQELCRAELHDGPANGAGALVQRWRENAKLLRRYRQVPQAEVLEDRAAELEAALRTQEGELLTLTEGARVSGYTADHLGRLVRSGVLTNHGRPNAPRVRRADLPRKILSLHVRHADPDLLGASRRQVAQAITTSSSRR